MDSQNTRLGWNLLQIGKVSSPALTLHLLEVSAQRQWVLNRLRRDFLSCVYHQNLPSI